MPKHPWNKEFIYATRSAKDYITYNLLRLLVLLRPLAHSQRKNITYFELLAKLHNDVFLIKKSSMKLAVGEGICAVASLFSPHSVAVITSRACMTETLIKDKE